MERKCRRTAPRTKEASCRTLTPLNERHQLKLARLIVDQGWPIARAAQRARRAALPAGLHQYNHHWLHTAIGKVPPMTRLINLPGQYI